MFGEQKGCCQVKILNAKELELRSYHSPRIWFVAAVLDALALADPGLFVRVASPASTAANLVLENDQAFL